MFVTSTLFIPRSSLLSPGDGRKVVVYMSIATSLVALGADGMDTAREAGASYLPAFWIGFIFVVLQVSFSS